MMKRYKAEIIEYDDGKTIIAYECDKERNIKCSRIWRL